MTDIIKVYQINLNKSPTAQSNLMSELIDFKDEHFICLIQEPHFARSKPSSIGNAMQAFHGKACNQFWPRAMIVASKNLNISLIEELTSRDTTCINLHTKDEELVICSSYQDINLPEVINNIDNCVVKAKAINKDLIIGADSNSHSQLWGCESNNHRGDVFEDFIALNNLTVCNWGNKPTFEAPRGQTIAQSIIDITLVTLPLADRVRHWTVHDETFMSDHKLISFTLNFNGTNPRKFRNYKNANWQYFNALLKKQKWVNPPNLWSKDRIDEEVKKLTSDITVALDKVCPEKEFKIKPKQKSWWNTELHNHKRNVKSKYRIWKNSAKNNATPEIVKDKYNDYKSARSEYTKARDKSKNSTWQAFTADCSDIYKLNKIIFKRQANSISMMEGCNTAIDSNKLLMDTHFPGSEDIPQPNNIDQISNSLDDNNVVSNKDLNDLDFLDTPRVKEAFNSMNSYNAGGPDGMKAIALQSLPNNMLYRCSKIYKACIKLSHTPRQWCEADVIFMAKDNKPCYNKPGSFRPISKFDVLLKGLEKLVKWELERTSLAENPLHENQHAYSRVRNVDTALVTVVNQIEKGLLRQQFTLAVFIDISGAFNNLNTDKAIQAMRDRGFKGPLVSWYESFVKNRVANSELLGTKIKRKLKLGTPQGGVLSTLCWNVPADENLKKLNAIDGIYAPGFSDDLVILTTGFDEKTMVDKTKRALAKEVKPWLQKYDLSMGPSKSTAVLFTNKRKVKKFPIKMDGEVIPYKDQVKYLGVILDSKLLGTAHIKHKLGKAKRHLMAFHYAIGKKFGPSPALMKKAYTTIVLPAFTYGCHIFTERCQQEGFKEALKRLNRLASLLIASVSPSTPTKALEVLYDLMPGHIFIEQRATETMARINNQIHLNGWDGIGNNKRNGIIYNYRSKAARITNNIVTTDRIPTELVKERKFKVHPLDDGRTSYKEVNGIQSYTDGSVLNAKTGCGVHTTMENKIIQNEPFYLGNNITIFQAEVTALKKSAEKLLGDGYKNQTITFYSDSQASLAALNNLTVKSNTVKKCITALNALGKDNKVHLKWVKAHVDIPGNEAADALAKRGTSIGDGPSTELLTPLVTQRNEIRNYYRRKWDKEWKSYPEARQTKIWFPTLDLKKSSELLKKSRKELSRLVQFFTGHNMLKRHRNLQQGIVDPKSCRLCGESEETSFHVIAECPRLHKHRVDIFLTYNNLHNPPEWSIQQIEKFLNKSPVGEMIDGNYTPTH